MKQITCLLFIPLCFCLKAQPTINWREIERNKYNRYKDNEGNGSTRPFYWSKKNLKLAIKPAVSFKTSDKSILLFTEKRNKFRLGELALK
jgi:hypothetical protein